MIIDGLKPLKSTFRTKKICAFDAETAGEKNDYVLNSFVSDKEEHIFTNRHAFINFLCQKREYQTNTHIFATNLMFDFFTVFKEPELQNKFQLLFKNGKLLKAKAYVVKQELCHPNNTPQNAKQRKLEFFDTINFFPAPVSVLGKVIGSPKLLKPACLGRFPITTQERTELATYCLQDSRISYGFMKFLQLEINRLGGNLKITIPSTAMDVFRRKFLKNTLKTPSVEQIKMMYKAYYGGRTEAFKRGIFFDVNVYDINSLYPYSMVNASFPHPNNLVREEATLEAINEFDGITRAVVDVPKTLIPYLPCRSDKLLFPYGKFEGHYSFYSLRQAMTHGVKVRPLGKALFSRKSFNPFKDYVTKLWDLRIKWKQENNPAQTVAKLLLNSLYGKFGEKILDRVEIEFLENYSKQQFVKDYKKGYKIEQVDDLVFIKKPEPDRINPHVIPIIASHVTDFARNELFKLLTIDADKTIYCDTDSVFTTDKLKESTDLGGLKLEYKFKELVVVKPKFYGGLTTTGQVIKIKGFQDVNSYELFKDVINGQSYTKTRFLKFFESKRRKFLNGEPYSFGVNEKIDITKVADVNDSKREWQEGFSFNKSYNSTPLYILK